MPHGFEGWHEMDAVPSSLGVIQLDTSTSSRNSGGIGWSAAGDYVLLNDDWADGCLVDAHVEGPMLLDVICHGGFWLDFVPITSPVIELDFLQGGVRGVLDAGRVGGCSCFHVLRCSGSQSHLLGCVSRGLGVDLGRLCALFPEDMSGGVVGKPPYPPSFGGGESGPGIVRG